LRKNKTAELYFEIDPLTEAEPCLVPSGPARSVGTYYLAVGRTTVLRVASLCETDSGALWLVYDAEQEIEPFYVNKSLEMLREACIRWQDVWAVGQGHDEFMTWLHAVDPDIKRHSEGGISTLWDSEYAEFVGPF
jgi:hypothetical protein